MCVVLAMTLVANSERRSIVTCTLREERIALDCGIMLSSKLPLSCEHVTMGDPRLQNLAV